MKQHKHRIKLGNNSKKIRQR